MVPLLWRKGRSSTALTLAAVTITFIASGCSIGTEKPTAYPSTVQTSGPQSPSPTMYTVDGFDVCKATDREPLSDFSPRTENAQPSNQNTFAGCEFEMRTGEGKLVYLNVDAQTTISIDSAESIFQDSRKRDVGAEDDGEVDGIGDEAYRKSDRDGNYYTSLIGVRHANLLVRIELTVESESAVSRSTLASMVLKIARSVLSTAPKA